MKAGPPGNTGKSSVQLEIKLLYCRTKEHGRKTSNFFDGQLLWAFLGEFIIFVFVPFENSKKIKT